MRLLERVADPDQLLLRLEVRREILGILAADAIERLANDDPQPVGGQPGGEPINRHDPADVQQLVVSALLLEVRVVERSRPAEMLQLARDDHAVAWMEPPLDVPPAEPRRVDRPGFVLEHGDGPLDAPTERRLDPDVEHAHPGGDDLAILYPGKVAELAHLAQVVVPPG